MRIKIYFGEKPLYLCDSRDGFIEELLHHPDTILVDELSTHAIHAMLHEIGKEDFHAGVMIHPDLDSLKKMFFHHFTQVEASGGLVLNERMELLFIFRRGKWDLPKGKMDPGEEAALCAEREIEEETGARLLSLVKKIGDTYHVYEQFGKKYLKTTHWYFFMSQDQGPLTPQQEEDISLAQWIPSDRISEQLKNSYGSIRDIISLFLEKPREA